MLIATVEVNSRDARLFEERVYNAVLSVLEEKVDQRLLVIEREVEVGTARDEGAERQHWVCVAITERKSRGSGA